MRLKMLSSRVSLHLIRNRDLSSAKYENGFSLLVKGNSQSVQVGSFYYEPSLDAWVFKFNGNRSLKFFDAFHVDGLNTNLLSRDLAFIMELCNKYFKLRIDELYSDPYVLADIPFQGVEGRDS